MVPLPTHARSGSGALPRLTLPGTTREKGRLCRLRHSLTAAARSGAVRSLLPGVVGRINVADTSWASELDLENTFLRASPGVMRAAAQSVLFGIYDLTPPLSSNRRVQQYPNITATFDAVIA